MRTVLRHWVRQKVLLAVLWSAGSRDVRTFLSAACDLFCLTAVAFQRHFGDTVHFLLSGIALSCISCKVIIVYSIVVRTPEGSRTLGKPKHRRKDKISVMYLNEIA
jgi:hypothetical protein